MRPDRFIKPCHFRYPSTSIKRDLTIKSCEYITIRKTYQRLTINVNYATSAIGFHSSDLNFLLARTFNVIQPFLLVEIQLVSIENADTEATRWFLFIYLFCLICDIRFLVS